MQKKSFWGLLGLTLLVLFSLPILFIFSQNEYYGHQLQQPAADFSLFDVQQQPHTLQQHRGRFTFLYFGYINCNDVCHNQVGVMYNLSQQAKNIKLDFIFVSLDAERDSPQLLDTYFNQLGDNFFALYHPQKKVIDQLTQAYKAPFYKDFVVNMLSNNRNDYELQHPGYLYLIDPQGQLQLMYPNQHLRYDYILKDVQKLQHNATKTVY